MCTAISFKTKCHYFGRNLDLEYNYCESVTITPRRFAFHFLSGDVITNQYALIGIASVIDSYPLYYDATNEHGLSMAGLNFPGNAVYQKIDFRLQNVAPFEFIPWILTQCKTVTEAKDLMSNINLSNIAFSDALPPTPLHWMISDRNESIVIEPMGNGVRIYENPTGVLTNNPPFEFHMHHLNSYLNLTANAPKNRFAKNLNLIPYSRGMGAIGLPGDLSSPSRFVKAVFTKFNSVVDDSETASVNQFFHILGSVEQQRGCVRVGESFERTIYSSCCNTDKCIYYYRTYENSQLTAVQLFNENLDTDSLLTFPLNTSANINYLN